MPEIGVPELLIVAVIVLLLFGPAKAADLGGALGKSIREFRKASSEDPDAHAPMVSASASAPAAGAASGVASVDAGAVAVMAKPATKFCTSCGSAIGDARFCTNCGAARTGA